MGTATPKTEILSLPHPQLLLHTKKLKSANPMKNMGLPAAEGRRTQPEHHTTEPVNCPEDTNTPPAPKQLIRASTKR
eukprot:gene24450-biopygen10040